MRTIKRVGTSVLLTCVTLYCTAPVALAQVPNPPPIPPPGLQDKADIFVGWMKWGGLVGGVIGMIICGLMMILGRRNRSATAVDGATGIPWILGGLTVIALSAGLVGSLL